MFHLDFYASMDALLSAGASTRVMIPAECAPCLPFIEKSCCARPLEVLLSFLPCTIPHLELLVEFGSRLDGICDGRCRVGQSNRAADVCCAINAALDRPMMIYEFSKDGPMRLDPSLGLESGVQVDTELLRLLIKVRVACFVS